MIRFSKTGKCPDRQMSDRQMSRTGRSPTGKSPNRQMSTGRSPTGRCQTGKCRSPTYPCLKLSAWSCFRVILSCLAQFFSFQWDNLWSETALFHFKIAILPPKSAPIWIILWLKVRKFIRDSDFSNRPKLSPLFEPLNWRKLTPIKAKNAANANQNKCSHTNSHTKNGKVTLGKSWFWTTKSWWTTFLD